MSRTRSKLEGVSQGLFWCGVLIGVISPLFTVLVVAAARIGAGHLSPLERFAALGLPGIAWLAFLASFVLALVLSSRGGSDRSLSVLPFLGVMHRLAFIYRLVSSPGRIGTSEKCLTGRSP
jgi:hypothetical protein